MVFLILIRRLSNALPRAAIFNFKPLMLPAGSPAASSSEPFHKYCVLLSACEAGKGGVLFEVPVPTFAESSEITVVYVIAD